jgi:hypothetical protein
MAKVEYVLSFMLANVVSKNRDLTLMEKPVFITFGNLYRVDFQSITGLYAIFDF